MKVTRDPICRYTLPPTSLILRLEREMRRGYRWMWIEEEDVRDGYQLIAHIPGLTRAREVSRKKREQ